MNVAVYEAKSKLSELLDKVCAGKEVVITRHGEPIARLVPVNAPAAPDRARAVREVRALSKRLNIRTGISLRKLVEEGRD
jgi:prevent-host-death family protein